MIALRTARLVIRNWQDRDRDLFFHINSDERVMAFFPFRRTREEADRMLERLRAAVAREGFGFAALERQEDGACIGFAGLHADDVVPSLPAGAVEIGWRLAPLYWGQGYATEAGKALLAHGFGGLGLDEIVSYAVAGNAPSIAVMRRLGMRADPAGDFDHPRVPDTHPHLRRHVLYRLDKARWRRQADGA